MAKSKVAQGKRAPKKPARKSVSREILRAAERIKTAPSESAKTAPASFGREDLEQFTAKREALEGRPVVLTLREACDLVGRDLEPTAFQKQVFDVLARELDVLSDLGESTATFDGWCALQNLRDRIKLAGKIAFVIGGAS